MGEMPPDRGRTRLSWRDLGPLAVAALLLLAGAWRINAAGGEGWPLLILGAVCFGVWIVLHVLNRDKER